jgi:hypothetical protein
MMPPPPAESAPPETILEEPASLPDPALPRFLSVEPQFVRKRGTWVGLSLALAALGGCGYLTRGLWWDGTVGSIQSALAGGQVPALGLKTIDADGQLQIQWDPHSPALSKPKGARLTIVDGPKLRPIALDVAHLASGVFTYGRETQKVDVTLTITESSGQTVREQTVFLGRPSPAPVPDTQAQDVLRDANQKLQLDLSKEREKSRKLDKENHYLRDQLEKQLRLKRLEKQLAPDK